MSKDKNTRLDWKSNVEQLLPLIAGNTGLKIRESLRVLLPTLPAFQTFPNMERCAVSLFIFQDPGPF